MIPHLLLLLGILKIELVKKFLLMVYLKYLFKNWIHFEIQNLFPL